MSFALQAQKLQRYTLRVHLLKQTRRKKETLEDTGRIGYNQNSTGLPRTGRWSFLNKISKSIDFYFSSSSSWRILEETSFLVGGGIYLVAACIIIIDTGESCLASWQLSLKEGGSFHRRRESLIVDVCVCVFNYTYKEGERRCHFYLHLSSWIIPTAR